MGSVWVKGLVIENKGGEYIVIHFKETIQNNICTEHISRGE